jgi:hypothetical protein
MPDASAPRPRYRDPTTVFPQAIGPGSAWNTALMSEVAAAIGSETRATGIVQTYALSRRSISSPARRNVYGSGSAPTTPPSSTSRCGPRSSRVPSR